MIKRIDNSSATVRLGFKREDDLYIKRYDNTRSNPRIQIWTEEELDDEPEEEKRYYCAICKSRLDRMPKLEAWQCSNCSEVYDTTYLHDKPLVDTKDFKLMPYSDFQYYPQTDENNPNQVFIAVINVDDKDTTEGPNLQIIRASSDRRVQHIRVRGSLADALRMVHEHDTKNRTVK